ncbi:MAG: GH36-type glycosyl hydrolase domain-containing protein, partial [Candidatus Hodarchaeota archaeon]
LRVEISKSSGLLLYLWSFEIVKAILRYTLKTVSPEGQIPYGIVGSGHIMPAPFIPSDQEMWLLWLASEYVLAWQDTAFLDEELPTYPVYGSKAGKASIKDLLNRCYQHLVKKTGTGKHGLQRLSNGDWNDMVVQGYVPQERHKNVTEHGESVLNAAMASFVLDLYSQLLTYINNVDLAQDVHERAEAQRKAVHSQWTGKWFKRAWLTEDLGWIGTDELWLEPQPWAIIGGAADPNQRQILVKSIDEGVRQPSKIGAMLLSKTLKRKKGVMGLGAGEAAGMGTNAGIWFSINGTLIWALSLVDGAMAWDEWKKNTRATHAEIYPDVWYGIWSAPDTVNSELAAYPGQTSFEEAAAPESREAMRTFGVGWTDFPVMNMHPHAWILYNTSHLVGIKFSVKGIEFTPALPKEEYKFSSPLVGFKKSKEGYSGWYAPKVAGTWKVTLKLTGDEIKQFKTLKINGKEEKIDYTDDEMIWSGKSEPDKPLKWVIKK